MRSCFLALLLFPFTFSRESEFCDIGTGFAASVVYFVFRL